MVSDFIEKHGGYLQLSNEEYEAAKDSPSRAVEGSKATTRAWG